MLSSSNQCNQSIIIVLNSLLIVLPERAPQLENKNICICIIYLLPRIIHFISGVTHMENDLLFCSKLMSTNGKIVVCKYII